MPAVSIALASGAGSAAVPALVVLAAAVAAHGEDADLNQPRLLPNRATLRLPPPWLGNLLVFGFLITLTITAFFLQTRAAEHRFIADTTEHARLLADAVRLHARGAVLAGEATDRILTAFLGNSARFILYLDDIEPFTAAELTGFADEAGLAMIRIQRDPSKPSPNAASDATASVQGPAERYPDLDLSCAPLDQLRRLPADGSFLFTVPRHHRPGCVMVVLESPAVAALRQAISVQQALDSVAQLDSVQAIQLLGHPRPNTAQDRNQAPPPQVRIIQTNKGTTGAEARAPIAGAELVLLLDGLELDQRRRELWITFAAFLGALLATGALGTWVLLKVQDAHGRQLRAYERRLSTQREEASLGRAASTIAHEIRNPLNAIGLGLQRLRLEADQLTPPQRDLIDRVMQAVQATNGTISGLLAYARPGQRERAPVDLVALVKDTFALHQQLLTQHTATTRVDLPPAAWVNGDAQQLRRALDNLLSNAREALPAAGHLAIALTRESDSWCLSITNDGFDAQGEPPEQLIEPWFTTKTNGTGLGLAIVQRILNAHQGELELDEPAPGQLRVTLRLPCGSSA